MAERESKRRRSATKLYFDERNRRWSIKFKGRSFAISCRQLRKRDSTVGDTKTTSRVAARQWWKETKHAALLAMREQRRVALAIQNAAAQQVLNARIGHDRNAAFWGRFGDGLQRLSQANPASSFGYDPQTGHFDGATVEPQSPVVLFALAKLLGLLQAEKQSAQEFASKHGIPTSDTSKESTSTTLAECAEKYKQNRVSEAERGKISSSYLRLQTDCVQHFVDFTGGATAVKEINATTIDSYHNHVLGSDLSEEFAAKRCAIVKQFVNWLYERHFLESVPRNLKSLTVRVSAKKIDVFGDDELTTTLADATGLLRLSILLALNVGATQKDIADLKPAEVDWKLGRIVRKRSKMQHRDHAPTVEYALWPETFSLLKQLRSKSTTHVLVATDGTPLVTNEVRNGKHSKRDRISPLWLARRSRPTDRAEPLGRLLSQLPRP